MPKLRQRGFNFFRENSPERQRGFTLIELLIVIVIIVILTLLLAVSYTTIQRNSRDTQRKGDLQAVAGVLERFYGDNSIYPSADAGRIAYNADCSVSGTPGAEDWGSGDINCNSTSYTKQLPEDPIGTTEYCYVSLASNQQYYLFANLEGQGNVDSTLPENECDGTGYNYRITSSD